MRLTIGIITAFTIVSDQRILWVYQLTQFRSHDWDLVVHVHQFWYVYNTKIRGYKA